jgi:hypothetical protein
MNNFIDFGGVTAEVDPAVRSLVQSVGERVGEKRLTPKERRRKERAREKAVERGRRGIVRWGIEVHPGIKARVEEIAEKVGVPESQVANELLARALEGNDDIVNELMGERKVGKNGSRRFLYYLVYRDAKGRPLEGKGATLRKSRDAAK